MSPDDDGLESVYADRTDPGAGELPGRATPTQATPAHAISQQAVSQQADEASTVVVDPTSQMPAPPSARPSASSRVSRPAVRRGAEATLVLQGRRVDELRREVIRQQKRLQRRRSVHIVWWGIAGAAAVLVGGWLASGGELGQRLLGHSGTLVGDEGPVEVALDQIPALPKNLQPNAHERADDDPDSELEPGPEARKNPSSAATLAPRAQDDPPTDPALGASQLDPQRTAARAPSRPKVPGDWGDGLEAPSRADAREGAAAPRPSGNALSLDDLEEER